MDVDSSTASASLLNSTFNDSKADVILRTSDGVDFMMYKTLLSLSSSFFDGMFSLPQPDSVKIDQNGLPIVPVPESSAATEKLLMFIHPAHAPVLESLDDIRLVLEPAIKYDMTAVSKRIVAQMERFINAEPLQAYCVAWQFKLRDQVGRAAKRLLTRPLLPRRFVKELDLVPATALHRLHEYHYNCGKAARAVSTAFGWIDVASFVRFDAGGICCDCANGNEPVTGYDNQSISPRTWWLDYMRESATLLQQRPCGDTVKDPELLNKVFKWAVQCRYCKDRVFTEMQEFAEEFAVEIERATDMIELNIKRDFF
ncbi:hypothetical protein Moror_16263 [Moniliophthora roreri MCA 2997]|uniref:BTB domain-containing protein n=2 Tax=Moniliophthora roreri TaxID=221103 RepID=V2XA36_MONRO|nr:hypothetical protein Moror_16263 [Moniliophthora roreri MCA 2997]KAI3597823.1 hypothetical protein WG66_012481 [Moniliophthora roreri]